MKKIKDKKGDKEGNLSPVDNMANEVLANCNAVVNKKDVGERILKKGEGKTTAGSGLTNY